MSVSSKHVELSLVQNFMISTDPTITMTNSVSSKKTVSKNSINIPKCNPNVVVFDRSFSLKHMLECQEAKQIQLPNNEKEGSELSPLDPKIFTSPRPLCELQAAAVTVQKVYKSYRTRRNLADCAILVEEMWWKAIDFATLSYDSVSFYKGDDKPEKVVSRWTRARKRVSKFAKGLSKDEKAQKLALQHWLEAIDPRHRYGHNLHLYYEKWFESESTQPFFYWLDVGHGKEVVHEKCPRSTLHKQCIRYLGPIEREVYEVIVENGRLVYKLRGEAVETDEGSKWIFVLSTSRSLYVGQKKKGVFQHSSFLAGAATTAAGRLVAHNGKLEAIWPYSGHYHPTEENFREFISFLEEHNVDLSDVKRYAVDDDTPSYIKPSMDSEFDTAVVPSEPSGDAQTGPTATADEDKPVFEFAKRMSCKWSTGAGPRIGIVRDYPTELQCRALEQVNLSPRIGPGPAAFYGPIPSPRPSPKVRISPRLTYLGIPSPRTPISASN